MFEVLAVSGSLRSGSTNEAALRTMQASAPPGVRVQRFDAVAAGPHFNPDDDYDPLPPPVGERAPR